MRVLNYRTSENSTHRCAYDARVTVLEFENDGRVALSLELQNDNYVRQRLESKNDS